MPVVSNERTSLRARRDPWVGTAGKNEGNLLLPFENPAHRLDKLLERWPAPPGFERNLVTGREICFEIPPQPASHRRLAECDVHFVVVLERAVINIGRSDD